MRTPKSTKPIRERAEELEAQVKDRDVLVEELVLSNQAQLERNETLTVQNEDLRGEVNEAVSGTRLMDIFFFLSWFCSQGFHGGGAAAILSNTALFCNCGVSMEMRLHVR